MFFNRMKNPLEVCLALELRGGAGTQNHQNSLEIFLASLRFDQSPQLHHVLRCLDPRQQKHERSPKYIQMADFISGVAPLGAPLAPSFEKCTQSAPEVFPRLQKCLQKVSQNCKSESQVIENPENNNSFGSWPGGLREAINEMLYFPL